MTYLLVLIDIPQDSTTRSKSNVLHVLPSMYMNGFGKSKLEAHATCHQSGWKILEGDPFLLGPSLCLFPHVVGCWKLLLWRRYQTKTTDPHIEVHHLFRWSLTVTDPHFCFDKTMLAKKGTCFCVFSITKRMIEHVERKVWLTFGEGLIHVDIGYDTSIVPRVHNYSTCCCLVPSLKPTKAPEIGGNPTGNEAKKPSIFRGYVGFGECFFKMFCFCCTFRFLP